MHVPFIRVEQPTEPAACAYAERMCHAYAEYTHILFTSQTAVHFFFKHFKTKTKTIPSQLPSLYTVGKATARLLQELGYPVACSAPEETAEGVVALLQETIPLSVHSAQPLHSAHLFWPHSAEARPIISRYLATAPFRSTTCILYQTIKLRPDPLPDLTSFDGVILMSPSAVHAFFACYAEVPISLAFFVIGPITAATLRDYGDYGYSSTSMGYLPCL